MAQSRRWERAATAVLLACALAAPFVLYPVFLMEALCFALFACAFNLLIGYVGLLSFGHAAFFGGAAYITAHTVKVWGLPPELGILAGVAVAAILGTGFGWLAIRRLGIYFAMITLALAQMVYFVALQVPFTGGEDGIQAVPRGRLLGVIDLDDTWTMYYFVLAVFLIGFGVIVRTINSPFGQVIKAIRENEPRATSLGYHADHYKLVDDVGLGCADDPRRRARHRVWPGGRGVFSGGDAALPGAARLLGHCRSGHHLRVLRPALPPWHRRPHCELCRAAA